MGEHLMSVKEVLVVKLVKRSSGSDGRTPHSPDEYGRLSGHQSDDAGTGHPREAPRRPCSAT